MANPFRRTNRQVGIVANARGCSVSCWAPLKEDVRLLVFKAGLGGPPRDSDIKEAISLQKDEAGYWTAETDHIGPGTFYMFLADGEPMPDPASRFQPFGVHGASCVTEEGFDWTDGSWKGLPREKMVVYEIHVGTFSKTHDFAGIIERLDYLKGVGVNTIELMPVGTFPGNMNWGYDVVFPFAVHAWYGGPIELKKLIDAAHAKGLAIILDTIYNHIGSEGNYLPNYAPYFNEKYHTPWGGALNYDGCYCDGVRNYVIENATMWLRDFHADGLRLDAADELYDMSAHHILKEISETVETLEQDTGRDIVLFAEADFNSPVFVDGRERGGYGIDVQWNDGFHHALHCLLTGERFSYYEDFGKLEHMEYAFTESFVYHGQYSTFRKKHFGGSARHLDYDQFLVFTQNHDHVGNRPNGDRLTACLDFESLKLAASLVLLSPNIPLLFMGEEYGETRPFRFFGSRDSDLEKTFSCCVLGWDIDEPLPRATLALYKRLIAFRNEHPAMLDLRRSSLSAERSDATMVLRVDRAHPQKPLILLFNFSSEPQQWDCAGRVLFDSASDNWAGPGSLGAGKLQPHSAQVIERPV